MLTKKQFDLLMLIDTRLKETGVAPSFDEMKDLLGLKSKSGIHRLISALEERGFLRRLPHRARALEVIKLPENMGSTQPASGSPRLAPVDPSEKETFLPNVIRGDFQLPGAETPARMAQETEAIEIPLYGRIAAGNPIEAVRNPDTVGVPAALLGSGEHYALEVSGDSMVDAGIHDGDTAIIKRANNADTGAIVVALIENEEVTLKRLRKKGQTIALEPANPDYETRIFGPDQVRVQGTLVGLFRKY